MIVQVSKFIITKRNIHLKEIEQFLESLKSNINPELVKISKKLIKEGKNIIIQNTKKKYAEVKGIAQNITKMRNELEQKMQLELYCDKSKLKAEIEGKIVQKEKEFEGLEKLFLVQFKGGKDGGKIPEMKKLELIEEFKGKQVTSAIHKSSNLYPEEAGSNNYLHLLDNNNNNMYIYDIREEKCIQRPITFKRVKMDIPKYSRYIELGGKIYLSGGRTEGKSTQRAFILNKENGELRKISPMKVPRESHALVNIYPHYIYAIGGWDCEIGTELSSCEVLDVRSRQSWFDAPQILKPKSNIGGCSFDNTYIYIFGGRYKGGQVADIEFLDSSHKTSWTPVYIQQHNVFGGISSVACAQINSHNNIIIYGGEKEGHFQDKSFIFDLNTMKIIEHSAKLKKGVRFDNNNPVIYEDKFFNISHYQKIIIFDMKSLKFNSIPEKIWKK